MPFRKSRQLTMAPKSTRTGKIGTRTLNKRSKTGLFFTNTCTRNRSQMEPWARKGGLRSSPGPMLAQVEKLSFWDRRKATKALHTSPKMRQSVEQNAPAYHRWVYDGCPCVAWAPGSRHARVFYNHIFVKYIFF